MSGCSSVAASACRSRSASSGLSTAAPQSTHRWASFRAVSRGQYLASVTDPSRRFSRAMRARCRFRHGGHRHGPSTVAGQSRQRPAFRRSQAGQTHRTRPPRSTTASISDRHALISHRSPPLTPGSPGGRAESRDTAKVKYGLVKSPGRKFAEPFLTLDTNGAAAQLLRREKRRPAAGVGV